MQELLLWYVWVQAFALGGAWLARAWLRRLPDRGYGIGKAAGVLFGAFFYWAIVALGWAPNGAGAAAFGLAALWAAAFAANRAVRDTRATPRAAIVLAEAVFLVFFLGWSYVRSYTPEIIESGGEKFMESMMINAILRAPTFPPNDPWLTGLPISYYYFGYLMFAQLSKLSGVAASIAFNLGGATIPALAATGAASLGFNLWMIHRPSRSLAAAAVGVVAALTLTTAGNLGGLMGALRCTNSLPTAAFAWLDVRDIAQRTEACDGIAPSGWFPWWWDWSRVVKDYSVTGDEQEIITEAPIFSFTLGDNHPHTLALPFLMLAFGAALSHLLYRGHAEERRELAVGGALLDAVALGAIGFLNTIDLPMATLVYLAARLLGYRARGESLALPAVAGVATLAAAYAVYLPFHVTLQTQAQGIMPNLFNGTRLTHFLLMFTPLFVSAAGFVALALRGTGMPTRALLRRSAELLALLLIGALTAAVLFALLNREARALLDEFRSTGAALGATGDQIRARLLERITSPWTALLTACVGAVAVATALARRAGDEASTTVAAADRFALLLVAVGAALVFAIEFVFVRDLFGTRLNSVFKFWYQTWSLWSIAAAYGLARLLAARALPAKAAGVVGAATLACGLLWAPMAIPAKWNFSKMFGRELPTLDGAAWLRAAHPSDAQVIDWINANVQGAPVLLEAYHNGSYDYRGRIATFTGLPTPLGWVFHEYQWRGSMQVQDVRKADVDALYSTTDWNEARTLLKRYRIEYVMVGASEREIRGDAPAYTEEALAKFAELCSVAFAAADATLYRCTP
jgi:YYY domain-containing protein